MSQTRNSDKPADVWMKNTTNLIFLVAIAACVVVVFRLFVIDGWTLVGDSDRLNAFLNIRKFEVEGIQDFGYVPAWNERIFMGNGVTGLHYLLPGFGIFAYLETLLPIQDLFHAMTFVTLLLVILAGWAAYAFIREVCGSGYSALVGSVLYCVSVYSLHRAAQLDASVAVLIHIPIGMLLVRRIDYRNQATPFLGLAAVMASLLVFTFLQEAAYAFVLFGAYALHRSIIQRSRAPVFVFVAALLPAVILAFPRVYTVLEDFRELDRTKDFQQTSWLEVYRFFAEGFFGRFQSEGRSIGNGANLHEGLQLVGSSFAALLIVAGALSGKVLIERIAGFSLLAVLSLVLGGPFAAFYSGIQARFGFSSIEAAIICLTVLAGSLIGAAYLWWKRSSAGQSPRLMVASHDPGYEAAFFLAFLAAVLAVVLISEARYLFYLLFLKVDFTHARFSIAGLLPLCTLVALFLGRCFETGDRPRETGVGALTVAAVVVAAAAMTWTLEGDLFERFVADSGMAPLRIAWNYALPVEFMRLAAAIALFLIGALVLRCFGHINRKRAVFGIGLGALIVFEAVVYGGFKLSGPHTRQHQTPFENNSYMNVPPGVLRPPHRDAQVEVRKKLEADRFRSVLIAPPDRFPAFVAPHLANFWGLRLVDGYSAGVPKRLASFDWPSDVRSLRSISFGSLVHVPWELLALLNVKYAVDVTDGLYYNVIDACREGGSACTPPVTARINPYEPLPRHFWARSVVPGKIPLSSHAQGEEIASPRGLVATAQDRGAVSLSWNAPWVPDISFVIESRPGNEKSQAGFQVVGRVAPSGRTYYRPDLVIGETYLFRARACRAEKCSAYSKVESIAPAVSGIPAPSLVRLERVSVDAVRVTWSLSRPDQFVVIERQNGPYAGYARIAVTAPGQESTLIGFRSRDFADVIRLRACNSNGCSPHAEPVALSAVKDQAGDRQPLLPLAIDLREKSFAEGFSEPKTFSTDGLPVVQYKGDRILVSLEPVDAERFLVVNEMYHPRWRAFADDRELEIIPTNTVMRGVIVPAGVSRLEMRFVPFLFTTPARLVMLLGLISTAGIWWLLRSRTDPGQIGAQGGRVSTAETSGKLRNG